MVCTTEGGLVQKEHSTEVRESAMRAYVPGSAGNHMRLRFGYLGSVTAKRALGSGAEREQVGIKLRARDGCNVLYIMWRLFPRSQLVVSHKSNPDKSRSADCGNGGYTTVRPEQEGSLPRLDDRATHELDASLHEGVLTVLVDGRTVWRGPVSGASSLADGPVGIRTDNALVRIDGLATDGTPGPSLDCQAGHPVRLPVSSL